MLIFRDISLSEIDLSVFSGFQRKQIVTKCRRKENVEWIIRDNPFVDDWSEQEYIELVEDLKKTVVSCGLFFGAFSDGVLKGFVSVKPELFGSRKQYADLVQINVSLDMRGKGIGKILFLRAKEFAKDCGAEKLYISAHSAVESQAFYKAMGCVEAEEYDAEHVEKEPCDCQLECVL